MTWDRIHRQEAILREKIAVLIQRLNDPRLGFVTITSAKLSRDKHYCTVMFSVLGSDSEERNTTRALADAAPRVRELLGPSLHTRVLPELKFVYDRVVVKESHLRTLIDEVTAERESRVGPDVDPDAEADTDVDTDECVDTDDDEYADAGDTAEDSVGLDANTSDTQPADDSTAAVEPIEGDGPGPDGSS